MRWILVASSIFLTSALTAGEFADAVKDLGEVTKRPAAIERLSKAGGDAYGDLIEGLKQNPDAEGIKADEKPLLRSRRLECARLLGSLADVRASAALMEHVKAHAIDTPSDAQFAGACASALGRVWADKATSAERKAAADELKRIVAIETLGAQIRWGALHGLEAMRDGADVAAPLLAKADGVLILRIAAINVVAAAKHAASADTLLDLWETQRLGPKDAEGNRKLPEKKVFTHPLGVTALFALGRLSDKRAVPGLVDVSSMTEFMAFNALRGQSIKLMQGKELKADSLVALVEVLKDETRTVQHTRAAQTLGDFGADGVKAFLALADVKAPEGQPETLYRDRVNRYLSSLSTEDALKAFAEAYRTLPEDEKALRDKVIEHLLNHRDKLKLEGVMLLRDAADDTKLDAPRRASCINAYAENRGKESFADLKRWVKSEEGVIRAQAVQNLGRSYIPLKDSKELLKEAAASPGENFAQARQNALQGLQRSDDKALLPIFLDALSPEKEPQATVRNVALSALDSYRRTARVKEADVLPAIKARLGDTDAMVRATAIRIGVSTAQLGGETSTAVEMVERGLTDTNDDVRSAAYQQVGTISETIKPERVTDAALKENNQRMKGEAVMALSRLKSWGEAETRAKVLDLGLAALEGNNYWQAIELLKNATDASNFNRVTSKVRELIEKWVGDGPNPDYHRASEALGILIKVKDEGYFNQVVTMAEKPNVSLRRKCVDFIAEFGTKKDVADLKRLRNMTDAAAEANRTHIDAAITKLENR